MPRSKSPRPAAPGLYYHVWKFYARMHRGKLTEFRDMKTLEKTYPVKIKAGGNGPSAIYDTQERPAAWTKRSAADMYGVRTYGRGNFDVEKCPGGRCPMKDHE